MQPDQLDQPEALSGSREPKYDFDHDYNAKRGEWSTPKPSRLTGRRWSEEHGEHEYQLNDYSGWFLERDVQLVLPEPAYKRLSVLVNPDSPVGAQELDNIFEYLALDGRFDTTEAVQAEASGQYGPYRLLATRLANTLRPYLAPKPGRTDDDIEHLFWLAERLRLPGGGDELLLRVLNFEGQGRYLPAGALELQGLDRVGFMLTQLDQLRQAADSRDLPHQFALTLRGLYAQLALVASEYEQRLPSPPDANA